MNVHVSKARADDEALYESFRIVTRGYKPIRRTPKEPLRWDVRDPNSPGIYGETGFERHLGVLRPLAKTFRLTQGVEVPLKLLVLPSSIGCEANMASAVFLEAGFRNFTIDTMDYMPEFTRLARAFRYPKTMRHIVSRSVRPMLFASASAGALLVPIRDDVRSHINFMDAQRFEHFRPTKPYDIVMVNNLFQYFDGQQTNAAFNIIAKINPKVLIFQSSARHTDRALNRLPHRFIVRDPVWRKMPLAADDVVNNYSVLVRPDAPAL